MGDSDLLIQHVGVLREPDAEALEGRHDHGVQVARVQRGRAAALVHDVAAHGADGALPVRGIHRHLHLRRQGRQHESSSTNVSETKTALENISKCTFKKQQYTELFLDYSLKLQVKLFNSDGY